LAFLLRNGYIYGYKMELNTGLIWIFLKYCLENNQVIKKVIFYSKPGKKIYLSIYKLGALSFLNKLSFIIVSTSKGILTIEEALLQDLGGELLFKVN
jgi:ribosomal protein S8